MTLKRPWAWTLKAGSGASGAEVDLLEACHGIPREYPAVMAIPRCYLTH